LLVDHFIESHRHSLSAPGLCARNDALALLKAYAWPGNIRELASVVAGASRRANGGPIGREHLPTRVAGALANGLENGQSLRAARQRAERRSVQDALEAAGGHRGRAAQQLGISSRSLLYKIKECGLRAPDQRRS
jgi:DNA-binding NtrC family response regulator